MSISPQSALPFRDNPCTLGLQSEPCGTLKRWSQRQYGEVSSPQSSVRRNTINSI